MAASEQKRWSQYVTETSDALNLEPDVFTLDDPAEVALVERVRGKKHAAQTEPFRSAMSMLTFYINRAGKGLPEGRKKILEKAKDELRRLYGRTARNASK